MLKETEGQLIGEAYGSLNFTLQITSVDSVMGLVRIRVAPQGAFM